MLDLVQHGSGTTYEFRLRLIKVPFRANCWKIILLVIVSYIHELQHSKYDIRIESKAGSKEKQKSDVLDHASRTYRQETVLWTIL